MFIQDIRASLNFSRQAELLVVLGGGRSRPRMRRSPQNWLTHLYIDCMPGSVMPVSVGVTVGSLSFGPHPITISLGSTSVGSIESKGE
jgi:hypothetical protein